MPEFIENIQNVIATRTRLSKLRVEHNKRMGRTAKTSIETGKNEKAKEKQENWILAYIKEVRLVRDFKRSWSYSK